MANSDSKIIFHITNLAGYTGMPTTNTQIIGMYHCTGEVVGQIDGQLLLEINVQQNESQIEGDLRTLVATLVDSLILPLQSYVANDVRIL
jgi:hypothetical protein